MLWLTIYFSPEGVEYSLNGRPSEPIRAREKSGGGIPFDIHIIRITSLDVNVYGGNEISATSYVEYGVLSLLDAAIRSLLSEGILDRASIRVLPCYVNEQTTANLSIRLFTTPTLFLGGIIHTKKGYAK